MPDLTFERPYWLWLMLLAIPAAFVGLRWFLSMSGSRRVLSVLLRGVLIALLSGLLAGASTVHESKRLAVIGVIDASGSVRRFADVGSDASGVRLDPLEAARGFLRSAAVGRGPDDLIGLVTFDATPRTIAVPTRAEVLDRPLDGPLADGTDIAEAIRSALTLIPADAAGRLVLFSDGAQTRGDALRAARAAAARVGGGRGGVPIDVVPLDTTVRHEVIVESLEAPAASAAESTITVRIGLFSTGPARGLLRLFDEGEPVDLNGDAPGTARSVTLARGRTIELAEVRLGAGRVHRFAAVFEPVADANGVTSDTAPDNNRAEAVTITPGRGAVLMLDGVGNGAPAGPGAVLAQTLRRSGIDVTLAAADAFPETMLALQAYDAVLLQNVPAEAIDDTRQAILAAYVRELGGGLVMIGGPDAFGAGGWKGSLIEPLLPVRLDLPEKLLIPQAAIMIVMDNSGSMARPVFGSSRTQQEVANEAAAGAVKSLDRTDLIGVITFNSVHHVLAPLAPNDDPAGLARRVRGIGSGGGTNIGPALRAAGEQLKKSDAKVKHILALSDGNSGGRESLPRIAEDLREEGITISTIAVGDGADAQTLRAIARAGGGVCYEVVNPNVLPKVFLRAVRIVRSPLIRETPFDPVPHAPSPFTAGLGPSPRLGGLVLTQTRPETAIVNAMLTPGGEPVLAHWNVELGQVVAFTSDAHRWASPWLDWPGYQVFWTQLVRRISRVPANRNAELTATAAEGELRLRLEVLDDRSEPLDGLSVPVTVFPPTGEPLKIELAQTGPGLYEAVTLAPDAGSSVVVARPRSAVGPLAPVMGGVTVPAAAEYARLGPDFELLADVAGATGGRVLGLGEPEAARLFDRSGIVPSVARHPIWRPLLLSALVVLLLDVACRRIAWDRFVSPRFGAAALGSAAVRPSGAALARLRTRPPRTASEHQSLGDVDAQVLAAAEARRRWEQRIAQAKASARGGGAVPSARIAEAGTAAESEPGSALRRAKRRAAERIEEEQRPADLGP